MVFLGVWLLAGRRLPAVSLASGTDEVGPLPDRITERGAPAVPGLRNSGWARSSLPQRSWSPSPESTWLRCLRSAGAHLSRGVGALLVLTGAYVAWYGAWELRVLAGNTGPDPVVNAAAQIRGSVR
ncbi:MAG: hypothetical protein H0V42_01260 [Nocardioidaceae bacterium]|nr:hypothetical protein [Nocardioidaceae bacterium]